jgi:hypothetical protein
MAPAVFLLGITGAALLYGAAAITPATSVLSAVEGLRLVTPVFGPSILLIAVAILVLPLAAQRHGTGTPCRPGPASPRPPGPSPARPCRESSTERPHLSAGASADTWPH